MMEKVYNKHVATKVACSRLYDSERQSIEKGRENRTRAGWEDIGRFWRDLFSRLLPHCYKLFKS